MYPIAQALKNAGNKVTVILGARRKDLLIMEEELKSVSDKIIVCTDDGSYGRKSLVTEPLKELCENEKPDFAIAIGPQIMMKFCADATRPYGVKTFASLNSIMVDGTGMCGGCRVIVGGKAKFVCVDGPEFDAHLVDWDNMQKRMGTYKEQEAQAFCKCKIK
jgi:ferredoxin--NADP+ reductase